MNNYFLPGLGMLVEYFQLSAANNYAVPEFIARPLEAITDNVLLFVEFPADPDKAVTIIGTMVCCLPDHHLINQAIASALIAQERAWTRK